MTALALSISSAEHMRCLMGFARQKEPKPFREHSPGELQGCLHSFYTHANCAAEKAANAGSDNVLVHTKWAFNDQDAISSIIDALKPHGFEVEARPYNPGRATRPRLAVMLSWEKPTQP